MFTRPNSTYEPAPEAVQWVLADEASPLNRIASLIPDGSRVLDVGAGNGLLAQVLHASRRDIVIDGVEPSPHAAALAAPHYRRFHTGFVEELLATSTEPYDFVVLADVIEHVADPLAFLRQLIDELRRETRFVIDTPNVAFGTVRLALLNGQFAYVDSGLLERTHLRFFTLTTLEQLVAALGLHIEKLYLLQRHLFETEIPVAHFATDTRVMMRLLRDELASTYQFLFVLGPDEVETERRAFGRRLTGREYVRWRLQQTRAIANHARRLKR
jgi:2-polyprenyl-3-methyl-5-hydroxy-6-metoxy-1,4-benzoquinol methylase